MGFHKEDFNYNSAGANEKYPAGPISPESKKAKAYRALEQSKGLDHTKRSKFGYEELKTAQEIREKEVMSGTIHKVNSKLPHYNEKGEVLRQESLYLILMKFFQEVYGPEDNGYEKANKEAYMALAKLASDGINVDYVPAGGSFKIEDGALSISHYPFPEEGEPIWDVCDGKDLILQTASEMSF